jgi:hypothetical protein
MHGRSDAIQILLIHCNTPFERVEVKAADWPAMKGSAACGDFKCLPMVEYCGKTHG